MGEDADQPFDRLREPLAAFPVARLLGQPGEQVARRLVAAARKSASG